MRASIDPIGGFAATGAQPAALERAVAELSPACVRDLAEQGFRGPFAVADGRIIHNAGGSEAQELAFAHRRRGRLSARARSGRRAARCRARHDLFPARRRRRPVPHHRQVPRACGNCGRASRQACGLAPKPAYVAAETAWRMMTQRDPYVNMLRTTIAVTRRRPRRRRQHHRAAVHRRARPARRASRAASRATRSSSCWRNPTSRRSPIRPPAPARIEDLTGKLCAAAWALFQEIEAGGRRLGRARTRA